MISWPLPSQPLTLDAMAALSRHTLRYKLCKKRNLPWPRHRPGSLGVCWRSPADSRSRHGAEHGVVSTDARAVLLVLGFGVAHLVKLGLPAGVDSGERTERVRKTVHRTGSGRGQSENCWTKHIRKQGHE